MAGSGRVRMVAISACIGIRSLLGMLSPLFLSSPSFPLSLLEQPPSPGKSPCSGKLTSGRFILQTHTQRLAEKALLEKSPLKTLTLEDFLETSRQALTGTLTPVTPESFAKWKKERLDKKAAEDEARKAKEATGRAMFEQGGWEVDSEEEGESGDDGGEGESEGESGEEGWDVEGMRRETERVREEEERRRVEGLGWRAVVAENGVEEDAAVGAGELVSSNGVDGDS